MTPQVPQAHESVTLLDRNIIRVSTGISAIVIWGSKIVIKLLQDNNERTKTRWKTVKIDKKTP